jgi:cytidyltransferase-like protein
MIFGTFDHLHPGHLDFFTQAKTYGDYLIVVVARDINVKKIKGHNPDKNENVRLREVHAVKPVDKAVLSVKKQSIKNPLCMVGFFRWLGKRPPATLCAKYCGQVSLPF